MQNELNEFFDAYLDAWPRGALAIAEFYAEPSISARGGMLKAQPSRSDLAALFELVDKEYRSKGYDRGERRSFDYKPLGTGSALVTICWAYKRANGETIWETTFSYNVIKQSAGWKIYVQTMHDL
jgi:hypothetical protein